MENNEDGMFFVVKEKKTKIICSCRKKSVILRREFKILFFIEKLLKQWAKFKAGDNVRMLKVKK